MFTGIKKFISNLTASLHTGPEGFSARKLTAWVTTTTFVTLQAGWLVYAYKNHDFSLLTAVLPTDAALITACLGLTTIERVKQMDGNTTTESIEINKTTQNPNT